MKDTLMIMKKNPRLIILAISLILVAQLIFAYSKACNDRPNAPDDIVKSAVK